MRKKLNDEDKKKKITMSINPLIYQKVTETHNNVSKYIEWLIYQDLRKNNIIQNDLML
jgi:hypothetical protein